MGLSYKYQIAQVEKINSSSIIFAEIKGIEPSIFEFEIQGFTIKLNFYIVKKLNVNPKIVKNNISEWRSRKQIKNNPKDIIVSIFREVEVIHSALEGESKNSILIILI